jgi:hypothetical protein
MMKWLALTMSLLLVSAAFAASINKPRPTLPVSIPFEFFSNQILVRVGVNGSEPVWFIVDSGASACVLDSALARKLRIKSQEENQLHGAGKGSVKFALARNVTYELPGLSFPVEESYVIDLSGQPALLGRYIGGILGYSLFARYVVDIDFDARILTLHDFERYHSVGEALPFTLIKHTPHIHVKLSVDGRTTVDHEVLVDTGSQDTIDDDLLDQSPTRVEVVGGVGLGQEFRTVMGRAESLQIGSFTLRRPFGAAGGTALIGNEVLRRFHLTFDYPHTQIFLSPGQHFADAFLFDASGIDLRWDSTAAAFVIHDVASPSAAWDAGLRSGETLVAINGQPASAFTIEGLTALLAEDGRELSLTVKRGTEERSVQLPLRKRL